MTQPNNRHGMTRDIPVETIQRHVETARALIDRSRYHDAAAVVDEIAELVTDHPAVPDATTDAVTANVEAFRDEVESRYVSASTLNTILDEIQAA